jgi:hypothetical protein
MVKKQSFLTSTGVELILKPISPVLRAKVIAGVEQPEKPTYESKTVGGGIEIHPHDATTIETDEEKAAWAAYLDAQAKAEAEVNERVAKLMWTRGIDWDALELPEDESWVAQQEELGVTVPEKERERKMHYAETELLSDPDEIKLLILSIMGMTGISEEVLKAVEALFRGEVEGATTGEPPGVEGTVELRDEFPVGEGGAGVGKDA